MGILRADRVSGLGGANAINGSVYFKAAQNLRTSNHSDFALGSNDFTIECWWNPGGDLTPNGGGTTDQNFISLWNNSTNRRAWGMYYDGDTTLFGLIATTDGTGGGNDRSTYYAHTFAKNTWVHLACVRISNTCTIYVDGTAIGSNTSFTGSIYNNTVEPLVIGGQLTGADGSHSYDAKILRGYMSNLRVINGDGIYTGNFTPPTTRLEKTANTVLLCCQSPGDITQEATGKDLLPYRSSINDAFPMASHIAPDVGEDHGTTFTDNTKFDTLSYMVPPGGTTAESNRGRGVIAGHYGTPQINTMSYINIQSEGNAINFGDLVSGAASAGCFASSTRGVWCGGYYGPAGTVTDTIQYVTIATQGNAIDSGGNLLAARKMNAGLSNDTRGVTAGGTAPSSPDNVMQYVTIASLGNASDFGDLTAAAFYPSAAGNTTRGIIYLGSPAPNTASNVINYITIATTGNASDFGDATYSAQYRGGLAVSNSTRLVNAGGFDAPVNSNVIDYVTIATTGNATDFGDLSRPMHGGANMSNSIRGVFAGAYGTAPAKYSNTMEYVTIATQGNGTDFGEVPNISGNSTYTAGCADSHGGIS